MWKLFSGLQFIRVARPLFSICAGGARSRCPLRTVCAEAWLKEEARHLKDAEKKAQRVQERFLPLLYARRPELRAVTEHVKVGRYRLPPGSRARASSLARPAVLEALQHQTALSRFTVHSTRKHITKIASTR